MPIWPSSVIGGNVLALAEGIEIIYTRTSNVAVMAGIVVCRFNFIPYQLYKNLTVYIKLVNANYSSCAKPNQKNRNLPERKAEQRLKFYKRQ